jgi:hypothetical protein
MSKSITGKVYRKEGREGERLYTEITCNDCGAKTYERKTSKIQLALERGCKSCFTEAKCRDLNRSKRKDGRTKHPLWGTYRSMMERCYNPTHKDYYLYGARGVGVCVRWIVDFWSFVEDMGECPDGYTIDRVDPDGWYQPDNCKWSSASEQALNRRSKFCLLTPEERVEQDKAVRRIYHKKNYIPTGNPMGRPKKVVV